MLFLAPGLRAHRVPEFVVKTGNAHIGCEHRGHLRNQFAETARPRGKKAE
jgi:hypothetical protein